MPSFPMTRHHETCTPLLNAAITHIILRPPTTTTCASLAHRPSRPPTTAPSAIRSSKLSTPSPKPQTTHTHTNTMPAPPSLSRLADLLKLRCSIYQQLYNPLNIRTGSKVLRQRLKGAAIASYYPRRMVSMKELQGLYPELET